LAAAGFGGAGGAGGGGGAGLATTGFDGDAAEG